MDIPQIQSVCSAQTGDMGQQYLITGKKVALRRWIEKAGDRSDCRIRDYEIVGFVLKGKLELVLGGEVAILGPGQSWLVPKGAEHAYRVLEDIEVVEATSPPARFANRDEPS